MSGEAVDDLVTVMIPACNEEHSIRCCLGSVLAQAYENLQVVVVVAPSTDRTAQIVEALSHTDKRIEMINNPKRNIPSSLNLGLACARGKWLVRVDAHSTVPPDYVAQAVQHLRQERWGGVGGRKDAVGCTPAGRAISRAMASRLGVGNSLYHHGTISCEVEHLAFGAYPSKVLRDLGGWDERLAANEDFELDHRLRKAGYRLLFEPRMRIAWECRQSLLDLWRQYLRYGKGKADVAILHPQSLRPRHIAPPLFVLYVLAAAVMTRNRPWRGVALPAPYLAVLAAETRRSCRGVSATSERLKFPVAIATMHLAWGMGFWVGLGNRMLRSRVVQ